ncbi:MAG: hypothetical protein ACKVVT_10190 [Dehalococcoidia bacterium]
MPRIRVRHLAIGLTLTALASIPVLAGTAGAGNNDSARLDRTVRFTKVLPALIPGDKENTTVIAQNDGNAPATIVMDVYTPQGVPIAGAQRIEANVPAGAKRNFDQSVNAGLAPGFRGVGVLSSDQPLNTLLERRLDSPNGKISESLHNAYGTGATKLALPYLANALDAQFNTRIAIANTSTQVACITLEYSFKPGLGSVPAGGKANVVDNGSGGGGCATGYPIPVNGQIAFAPTAVDGAIPYPSSTANALFGATITSSAPVTAAADAWVSGLKSLGAYDAFVVGTGGDLGVDIVVPLGIKHGDGFLSQYIMSNPNASSASVTITYTGNTGTHVKTLTIPANGSEDHGVYSDSVVPVGFVGAARIQSTQPIAVVAFFGKMTTANSFIPEETYALINGIPNVKATTKVKFPYVVRRGNGNSARCDTSGDQCGFNGWQSVSVVGGGTANLTIQVISDPTSKFPGCQGSTYSATFTRQITDSFVFYQNLNSGADNGLNGAPPCFDGSMIITSDKPIVAVGDFAADPSQVGGDQDARYDAFRSN